MRSWVEKAMVSIAWVLLLSTVFIGAEDKKVAPALNTRDINGKTVDTKTLLEKGPVIIWFWNSCCGIKKPQVTALKTIYSKYRPKGLEIVGISEDGVRKLKDTKEAAAVNQMPFPIVMDNSMGILNQFKGFAVPSVYLITQDGKIAYYKSGYLQGDEKELENELYAFLGDK